MFIKPSVRGKGNIKAFWGHGVKVAPDLEGTDHIKGLRSDTVVCQDSSESRKIKEVKCVYIYISSKQTVWCTVMLPFKVKHT